ncbi:Programmed cell death protein 2 [Frankliniella fusca]|uniref:Programmed cell death protein 2 n=1 Tax=Frankliniella fusca TaxID=407009 RepID=A0AAE1GUC3_9NEOP|nr:Programmed cell death protein 2 [Frankliniella fusca]
MEHSSRVDVGFVDEADHPWKLDSKFFPSKVGGRPSWLQFTELPTPKDMECVKCHEACIFLCQVYAPLETRSDCFHRTVFVFMCRNPSCHALNDNAPFIVYRSQLKRENDFYPFDPPEESEEWHPECRADKWTALCAACGNAGTSHCGRCRTVKYCCRSHQVCHWKDVHKLMCNSGQESDCIGKSSCLLPEYELIVEPEEGPKRTECKKDDSEGEDESDDENAEEERVREFQKLSSEGKTGTLAVPHLYIYEIFIYILRSTSSFLGMTQRTQESKGVNCSIPSVVDDESVNADLINMAACAEDKAFNAFKARVAQNPGQVLRYQRGGKPLWLSEHHIPMEDSIPPCFHCGAKRIFEFQV